MKISEKIQNGTPSESSLASTESIKLRVSVLGAVAHNETTVSRVDFVCPNPNPFQRGLYDFRSAVGSWRFDDEVEGGWFKEPDVSIHLWK